ncbi:acyl-CoA dehydrogenase C-terminal domain-containing protein [Mycobacterium vicinigordonae]|uniref:Acyl-CoA dehydrogenase C-terminal domain-containing protein n=1 Tax=Mycobacterium vicinigordonae TaxID=1719132 RepID=A0A7D6HR57_9MYCO|nr:acyl-CoA dehydrogenase C-terminal domain-containing protein [Mycobacterium vicinigordonae]QLL05352.1 acyl-CoA dehydrogenase C-terminal domain-containing protein [Mycobacterium vicinigordonae]
MSHHKSNVRDLEFNLFKVLNLGKILDTEKALEGVQAVTATLSTHLLAADEQPAELYKVGLGAVRFLPAVGDLLVGWQLLHQAQIALTELDAGATESDVDSYHEKIAVAQYFTRNVLPALAATQAIIDAGDGKIMELDDTVF